MLPLWLALLAAPSIRTVAPGWTAPQSTAYEAGVDRKGGRGGSAALYLKSAAGDPSGYAARQTVRADAWKGKRIRLTGWIKADAGSDGGALWLRIDAANGDYILDGMLDSAPVEWRRVSIVAAIPEDAAGISFGLRMRGKGKLSVDDLAIELVAPKTMTTTIERRKDRAAQDAKAWYDSAELRPVNLDFEAR